jgi:hypothetical protein
MKSHDQISATYLLSRTGLHVNTASPPPWRLPSNGEDDDPCYIPAYTRKAPSPHPCPCRRTHVILPLAYRAPMSAIGRSVSIYLISLENPAQSSAHRGSTTPASGPPITSLPPFSTLAVMLYVSAFHPLTDIPLSYPATCTTTTNRQGLLSCARHFRTQAPSMAMQHADAGRAARAIGFELSSFLLMMTCDWSFPLSCVALRRSLPTVRLGWKCALHRGSMGASFLLARLARSFECSRSSTVVFGISVLLLYMYERRGGLFVIDRV